VCKRHGHLLQIKKKIPNGLEFCFLGSAHSCQAISGSKLLQLVHANLLSDVFEFIEANNQRRVDNNNVTIQLQTSK
jgi:hypothetical protein